MAVVEAYRRLLEAVDGVGPVIQARLEVAAGAALESTRQAVEERVEGLGSEVATKVAAELESVAPAFEVLTPLIEGELGKAESTLRTFETLAAQTAQSAGKIASEAASQVDSELAELQTKTAEVERRSEESFERIRRRAREGREDTRDNLDKLLELVSEGSNEWEKIIKAALEAVASGAADMQDLVSSFGDMRVLLDGENQRIADLLASVDENQLRNRFQELLQFVSDESKSLDEVVAELDANLEGRFKGITDLIEKLTKGEGDQDALLQQLRNFRERFQGQDIEDLVDEILQRLQDELRR